MRKRITFTKIIDLSQNAEGRSALKRIGILSDTHGTFDAPLRDFFADVDELWHAGDFGGIETADAIAAFKPLRGVCGNIDGGAVRLAYPRWQLFDCEEVRVAMTHIGGYPGPLRAGCRGAAAPVPAEDIRQRTFAYFEGDLRPAQRLAPHQSGRCGAEWLSPG